MLASTKFPGCHVPLRFAIHSANRRIAGGARLQCMRLIVASIFGTCQTPVASLPRTSRYACKNFGLDAYFSITILVRGATLMCAPGRRVPSALRGVLFQAQTCAGQA